MNDKSSTSGCKKRSTGELVIDGDARRRKVLHDRLHELYEVSHGGHLALRSMEGMRGFAVLLVFVVHFVTLAQPLISGKPGVWAVADAARSLGNVGVDLFFVLSGFLIYGSLIRRPQAFSEYLYRRVQRIYPVFVAVFVLYLALSALLPSERKIPSEGAFVYLVANFLLLPGVFPIEPMISVAWSLSYELFFYLSVPLVIWAFRLRDWNWRSRLLLLLLFACTVIAFPSTFGGHIRLSMFAAGMIVAELVPRRPSWLTGLTVGWVGLCMAIAGFLFLEAWRPFYKYQLQFLFVFVGFTLFVGNCLVHGAAAKTFCWTPMRWLGNMSYSYYLIHGITLKFCFFLLYGWIDTDGRQPVLFFACLLVGFVATLVSSTFLFVLVEKRYSLVRNGRRVKAVVENRAEV